jgi:hypothetical protein
MLDGDEPDFETLLEAMDELEGMQMEFDEQVSNCGLEHFVKSMEKDLAKKSARALRDYDFSWVQSWCRPIHTRCSQTAPCGCVVHFKAASCVRHGCRIPQSLGVNGKKAKALTRKPTAAEKSAGSSKKRDTTPEPMVIPNINRVPLSVDNASMRAETSSRRATWLTPASEMATTESQMPPPVKSFPVDTTLKRKAVQQAKQPQAAIKKPHAHTAQGKMIKAAETCKRLDAWVHKKGDMGGKSQLTINVGIETGKYDLQHHNSTYDPFLHGPFRKNGEYWFLRPDGKAVRAQEGVCEFNERGELEPC